MNILRRWRFALLIAALAVSLAACASSGGNGDTTEEEQPPAVSEDGTAGAPSDEAEAEQPVEEPAEEPAQDPAAGPVDPADLPETKDLAVNIEGTTEKVPAKITKSEQGYAFYLMKGFEFTPEEPGKDMVFYKTIPDFYMRVEKLPSDSNIDDLKKNAEDTLKVVGKVASREGDKIFDPNIREHAKFFLHASNAEVSREIILMESNGALFRYTLNFENSEAQEGVSPRFYPMINSVVATK